MDGAGMPSGAVSLLTTSLRGGPTKPRIQVEPLLVALTQAVMRVQSAVDARTTQLGTALNSMRKGFSLESGRMIDVSTQFTEAGAENVIPVSSMVRLHWYHLVNIEVSFEVSAARSRRTTPGPPTIFRLHPCRGEAKQQATLRITARPQVAAEFAVDGVKYGELVLNPELTSRGKTPGGLRAHEHVE